MSVKLFSALLAKLNKRQSSQKCSTHCITKQAVLLEHIFSDFGPKFCCVWKRKLGKRMLHDQI